MHKMQKGENMTAYQNVDRDWVIGIITEFCNGEKNNLNDGSKEAAWDTPLIGFANGADPIFNQYKDVVGQFHWTPLEAIEQDFPDLAPSPENLTVISWILPQTEATKRDNRQQTTYPDSCRVSHSSSYGITKVVS